MNPAMEKRNKESKRGGALALVLLLMMVFTVLGLGMMSLSRNNAQETVQVHNRAKAFWIAEAGAQQLKAIITSLDNKGPLVQYNLVDNGGSAVLRGSLPGAGSYEVFVKELGPGNTSVITYEVRSVGQSIGGDWGAEAEVSFRVRLRTGSENVWSTHDERGIWFATGDVMNGPARTNGKYYIWGKPKFLGFVSTSSDTINYNDYLRGGYNSLYTDPEVFLAGIELGAPETDFNPDIIEDMQGDALVMPGGEHTVILQGSSVAVIQSGVTNVIAINAIGSSDTWDNILYFPGPVKISGTLDGQVSIASEDIITIIDDVVYSDAPSPNHGDWGEDYVFSGDDALGLFTKRKVEIDYTNGSRYSYSTRGVPINIHAAIFATKPQGSDAWSWFNSGFGARWRYSYLNTPYINLYGSIQQHTRGVIGTTRGGGYLKNYRNDIRFRNQPPPGAPYDPPQFSHWKWTQ